MTITGCEVQLHAHHTHSSAALHSIHHTRYVMLCCHLMMQICGRINIKCKLFFTFFCFHLHPNAYLYSFYWGFSWIIFFKKHHNGWTRLWCDTNLLFGSFFYFLVHHVKSIDGVYIQHLFKERNQDAAKLLMLDKGGGSIPIVNQFKNMLPVK